MIKLSLFQMYDDTGNPPVWVNPDQITYMNQSERQFRRVPGEEPAVKQTVTIISFAAGLHEGCDAILVMETPEEIVREIYSTREQD